MCALVGEPLLKTATSHSIEQWLQKRLPTSHKPLSLHIRFPNTPRCAPTSQRKHRNHYWAFFQHPSAKSASPSLQCFSPALQVQRKKEGLPPSKSVRVPCIPSLLTLSGTFCYTCPVSLYNWVLSLFTRPCVDATLPSRL